MNLYRQAIALFGLVLPLVVSGIILGICYMVKSKMDASYEAKKTAFAANEAGKIQISQIEKDIKKQRVYMERWDELLKAETTQIASQNLLTIRSGLPPKEIQQTSFEGLPNKGGLGTSIAQDSSQVKITFRGTYRTMQKMFLELETRMPQLQLEDLRMDVSTNQSSLLNFQVTYTAWKN